MKKSNSQNIWLRRQDKDLFAKLSKVDGYRSRSAYKLLEINKKFKILKNNINVIDLGASPGGWSQVVAIKVKSPKSKIISIDKLNMAPVKNCHFILEDIESIINYEHQSLKENTYDLILSDMAPNSSGHRFTDQVRSEKIWFLALKFSFKYLTVNGNFVCKIMRNSGEQVFIKKVREYFKSVKIYKPISSRNDSKEIYLIALGFNNLHKD